MKKKNDVEDDQTVIEKAEQKSENKTKANQEQQSQVVIPTAPQSISLKSMMNPNANTESKQKEEKSHPEEELAFSQEDLETIWKQYTTEIQQKQPRLSSALQEHQPTLQNDGFTAEYPALHEKQKLQLIERSQGIVDYLRKHLKNKRITIEWIIQDQKEEEAKRKIYTLDDKLKFLIQKNPAIDQLKKDLELDFR